MIKKNICHCTGNQSLENRHRVMSGIVTRFEVFEVVKIQVMVFWVVILCTDTVDTNILEDLATSIFRVKCMVLGSGPTCRRRE
jgi:hypothetical protein